MDEVFGTHRLERERVRSFYAAANERLPQYATETVLRARLGELPAAKALYEWTVEQVEVGDEGVTLGITSRSGERGVVRAAYVVGCDGSRSRVREATGITQTRADHDRLLPVFRSKQFDRIMARFPGVSFVNVAFAWPVSTSKCWWCDFGYHP